MSEETHPVKIKKQIADTLKTLKNRWKLSNVSEVIDKLLKDRADLEARVKTLENRLQTSTPTQSAPILVEAPTTPTTTTDTPKTPGKPIESPTIQAESRLQECLFYSFSRVQGLVHCSKDYDTKGIIHRVTQEVCDKCWDRIQGKKSIVEKDASIADQTPCLCRFNHADEWLCAHNAPTVRRLEFGLKTCQACPDRLTEENVRRYGLNLITDRFVTCGAKIKDDPKAGTIVWDSRDPTCPNAGVAVPVSECFRVHCPNAKTIQYAKKG